MGTGSMSSKSWGDYKASKKIDYATTAHDIYSSGVRSVKNEYSPYNVMRESCDSDEHPNSTPIIIALDVTGSMSSILLNVAKKVGDTMLEIISRKCVSDPQICFVAVDDYITSFEKCIQVTQFESDIRIAKQMNDLSFIELGGGNTWESYADVWWFAKNHTKCDAIKKGRKGVIITIGDDGIQTKISRKEIKDVFGDTIETDSVDVNKLYSQVKRDWEVYHISLENGNSYRDRVKKSWNDMLGQRHIILKDEDKLNEIIVSLLQTLKGDDIDTIASTWDHSTALAVKDALSGLSVNTTKSGAVMF